MHKIKININEVESIPAWKEMVIKLYNYLTNPTCKEH